MNRAHCPDSALWYDHYYSCNNILNNMYKRIPFNSRQQRLQQALASFSCRKCDLFSFPFSQLYLSSKRHGTRQRAVCFMRVSEVFVGVHRCGTCVTCVCVSHGRTGVANLYTRETPGVNWARGTPRYCSSFPNMSPIPFRSNSEPYKPCAIETLNDE